MELRLPMNVMRSGHWVAGVLAGLMLAVAGCETTRTAESIKVGETFDASTIASTDNVTQLHVYYPGFPWLTDVGKPVGFRARAYFTNPQNQGVFVSGPITIRLERVQRPRRGVTEREPLQEWTFDEAAAMEYRVQKKSIMGLSYGFILMWDESLDLSREEIAITFEYEREDGRVIRSSTRLFPLPG